MSTEDWTKFCEGVCFHEDLGLSLDASLVELPADLMRVMTPRMKSALEAMRALENGSIANADEGRMVGHYWLRAPALAPNSRIRDEIESTLARLEEFVQGVHSGSLRGQGGPFENALLIGIGGSCLGPQFVARALGGEQDAIRLHFLDNTDPDGIATVLHRLQQELDRTLVIVVSKSGGTPETRNGMILAMEAYQGVGLEFAKHAVAVTQEGSQLDQRAVEQHWIARFPMWDWVGGRTSELSAVGLLPAALQGIDIREMLAGSASMDEWTRQPMPTSNPAALLALCWYHLGEGRGTRDMVILPYKDRLELFSRYLQQLVMESLGKELDRQGNKVCQGIAVYGNKGSTDQHAYVQQLRDGLSNFFVTFVEVLEDGGSPRMVDDGVTAGDFLHGFLQGTRQALHENGRPSITITIDSIRPSTIGALIALFERAVGLYAELIDINAYHQPGVEAGKKAAAVVLQLQSQVIAYLKKSTHPQSVEQIARGMGKPESSVAIYHILRHLEANPGRGVVSSHSRVPSEIRFAATPDRS